MSRKEVLRNWLKETKFKNNEPIQDTETNVQVNQVNNELINQAKINFPINFNENGEIDLFENDSLVIYVQKATHQRNTRFRLQDSLFKIKVRQKESVKSHLLLKDLLEVFDVALKFILQNIRTFFDSSNHHIAYLTLYQEPLVNGINTGGFDIEDDYVQLADRLLSMLSQFLVSNQDLALNDTFNIYINILSLNHMQATTSRKTKKRKSYGMSRTNKKKVAKPNHHCYWSVDIPQFFDGQENIFYKKCILTTSILANLQNEYFESNCTDLRYIYALNINSSVKSKQTQAYNILQTELDILENYLQTKNIEKKDYDNLELLAPEISNFYKSQIFLFSGIQHSSKLKFKFPIDCDSTLKPIYMYEPFNEPHHLTFIRHLTAYFRSNLTICLYCNQGFKSANKLHLCKKIDTCFACRQPFQNEATYINCKRINLFCDKFVVEEQPIKCNKCNLTLYTKKCFLNHKKLCGKNGRLGWQCTKCLKFFYRAGNHGLRYKNSNYIQNSHTCGYKLCTYCHQYFEGSKINHLCSMKKEYFTKKIPSMAFISFSIINNSATTCATCYFIQDEFRKANSLNWVELYSHLAFPNLFCSFHKTQCYQTFEPNGLVIYKETLKSGQFNRLFITSFSNDSETQNALNISSSFEKSLLKEAKNRKLFNDTRKNIDFIANIKNPTLLEKFLQIITQPEWQNYTIICHDVQYVLLPLIVEKFVEYGLIPNVLQNGQKIISFEIKELKIRFLNSSNYLQGSLYSLADQYSIKYDKMFFPQKFNIPENYDYYGSIPNITYFLDFNDSSNDIKEKEAFIQLFQNKKWNFQKEMLSFLDQNVSLMIFSFYKFFDDCFNLQKNLICDIDVTNINYGIFLHPCADGINTFSAFIYKLFKGVYLNKEDLFIVNKEYGISTKQVSQSEYDWACFMSFQYPEKEFQHAFNHIEGQKYFKEAIPDLYSKKDKEAHFFNGCLIHGHFPNCLKFPNANKDSSNFLKKTYEQLNNEFEAKLEKLLINNANEIDKITVHWECHFEKITQDSTTYKRFLNSVYKPHPLVRLTPRISVRGGFSDVYNLKWSKTKSPNERFYYCDINGLYSYCAINKSFFVGQYKVLIGNDLQDLKVNNTGKLLYHNQQFYGTILLTILPPSNLQYPFLLFRLNDSTTVYTLCRKCSENMKHKIDNFNMKKCQHSVRDRALTSVWFDNEIEYALSLGYKILHIHEAHFYENKKPILKNFTEKINALKLQASDLFENISDRKAKIELCKSLNTKMNLSGPFQLNISNIKPNTSQRTLMKLAANALFGKLQQRNDHPKSFFVNSQAELESKYYDHQNEIISLKCYKDIMCEIRIKPDLLKLRPNRDSNCYIGGQITAYAREIIHKYVMSLINVNAKISYVDTDCIMFSLSSNTVNPLPISHVVGEFKNVIPFEIENYYCLGIKNYLLSYKVNNKTEIFCKIKGLAIKSFLTQNEIDEKIYDDYINHFVKQSKKSKVIHQLKNTPFRKQPSKLERFTFSNSINVKKNILNDSHFTLLPFGFRNE